VSTSSRRSRLAVRRPRIRDLFELLVLLLIGLKLAGVIHWSWWWVLTPIWIGLVPAVLIVIGLLTMFLALHLINRCLSLWPFTIRRARRDRLLHGAPFAGPPRRPPPPYREPGRGAAGRPQG
jgi:hypothetical protein